MKFITINNNIYSLAIRNFGKDRECSKLHELALDLIRKTFPLYHIVEELPIKPYLNQTLYIDIFIPQLSRAFEVQGQQHENFNSYYHSDKSDLFKQRRLDNLKKQWCQVNNITLTELLYSDKRNWSKKILC